MTQLVNRLFEAVVIFTRPHPEEKPYTCRQLHVLGHRKFVQGWGCPKARLYGRALRQQVDCFIVETFELFDIVNLDSSDFTTNRVFLSFSNDTDIAKNVVQDLIFLFLVEQTQNRFSRRRVYPTTSAMLFEVRHEQPTFNRKYVCLWRFDTVPKAFEALR